MIFVSRQSQKAKVHNYDLAQLLHYSLLHNNPPYSGSEYGIVLLSTVRSKPVRDISDGDQRKKADIGWIMKNLGFVTDKHQICVGITRCKYGLVIVG